MLDGSDERADPATVQSAWNAELRSRLSEIEEGSVELVDGQGTFALARAELAARRR